MVFKTSGKQVVLLTLLTLLCDILAIKKFNLGCLPTIIWWTDLLYPHTEKYCEIQCPLGKCMSSSRRRKYRNDNITVAYLFYGTDFYGDDLPLPRRKNHVWALLHEESPMNNYIFSHQSGIKIFNYTGTFSRNSDFPLTTQHLPSLEYLTERKPMSLKDKNKHRRNGTAPILYLQSHCNVASDRDSYVKELMNFIAIDSYGGCLHNRDLPHNLATTDSSNDEELLSFVSKYKFHLAFENAICDDYITEKLFRVFHVGSVPIYKGSPSVRDWAPSESSVIVADDFHNPKYLADFIKKMDQNDALYETYLSYKEKGISNELLKRNILERTWGVNDPNKMDFIRSFECYVCDKIQRGTELSSFASLKHMNCPQPHASFMPEETSKDATFKDPKQATKGDCPQPKKSYFFKEPAPDEWSLEDWTENFFFAYDQARAIELMIHTGENDSSRFMDYILKLKYPN